MAVMTKYPEPLIFGLDIGTRSIVGTVGYKEADKFNVVAMAVKFHDSRSMIDGQVHDIGKVSDDIVYVKNSLEKQLGGRKLHDVCIAAAGRVLKTAVGHGDYEFEENTDITQEYIHSIDLIGVEKAHEQILEELHASSEETKYFCVGYTVIKYYLNDYEMLNLEGHKGTKIGADVLATFLPEEVVDSLYTAVEKSGLYVSNLTLEPIAAINVAIPENFRLLNIALLDVGAGTSDICITRDGSIIGYGMIPSAGDEITEILIKKYLIDFDTAEKLKMSASKKKAVTYKDIMGIAHKITPDEILKTVNSVKSDIAKKIAKKITELNGGVPVSAVFVVGGGGKIEGFTDELAHMLKLPNERVALRGQEVMHNINFLVEDIKKDPLYVTPIGICLNYFDQKNNFIFVNVNGERVKLYNNDKLTIFDAAVQYGLPNEHLFPKRGKDLTFKINGKSRIVRGYTGEAAIIRKNGDVVGMNALIEANDRIEIEESTAGDPATVLLGSLPEFDGKLDFIVNDVKITCPKFAVVNGNPETESYQIKDGDNIVMQSYYLLDQLLTFMDVRPEANIFVNNKKADMKEKIYENFVVSWNDQVSFEDLPEAEDKDIKKISENIKNKKKKANLLKAALNSSSGDAYEQISFELSDDEDSSDSDSEEAGSGVASGEEDADAADVKEPFDMHVIINGRPYTLTGKNEYRFVDALDACNFDMSTMKGSSLVTRTDGEHANFIDLINEGANIEIYWEK